MSEQVPLSPIGYDKHGPKYSHREVNNVCLRMINSNQFFESKVKRGMATDIDKATELVNEAIAKFDHSLTRLMGAEQKIAAETKKISGQVRDTTQKLNDGLIKIQKQANFDKLEQYVILLERADKALNSLAELEKTGKLEKIASAIR